MQLFLILPQNIPINVKYLKLIHGTANTLVCSGFGMNFLTDIDWFSVFHGNEISLSLQSTKNLRF